MSTINQAPAAVRPQKAAKRNAEVLKLARQLHLWLGVFFAPAIIFFAFSGALQTFSYHETEPGSTYEPPVWIQKMAQFHKKQNLQIRQKRPTPPGRPQVAPPSRPLVEKPLSTLLAKWFVFLTALGLMLTSVLGVYMAFQYNRNRRLIWTALILGTALPIVPILFH